MQTNGLCAASGLPQARKTYLKLEMCQIDSVHREHFFCELEIQCKAAKTSMGVSCYALFCVFD